MGRVDEAKPRRVGKCGPSAESELDREFPTLAVFDGLSLPIKGRDFF